MNTARSLISLGLKGASNCCCRRHGAQSLNALRCMSVVPAAVPRADGAPKSYPPKIEKLATEISGLTLIEVTELSELLKKSLNLPDAPAMSFAAAPQASGAAAGGEAQEEDAPKKSLKRVKMTGFDEKQKISVIKFIRTIMGDMNLVQAKKFVESAPIVVKGDLIMEEAEALQKELEAAGAKVVIE